LDLLRLVSGLFRLPDLGASAATSEQLAKQAATQLRHIVHDLTIAIRV
jgi:hypothetical protein